MKRGARDKRSTGAIERCPAQRIHQTRPRVSNVSPHLRRQTLIGENRVCEARFVDLVRRVHVFGEKPDRFGHRPGGFVELAASLMKSFKDRRTAD